MSRLCRSCVYALAFLFAAVPVAHAQDDVVELYFRAHVTIAADGSLRAMEWGKERKVPEVLRTKLEDHVRSWEFAPGTVDGAPAETETTLRLRLTAAPAVPGGSAYTVRVDNAETGPSMFLPPPEYPREALRFGAEAYVVADMTIDADGKRHLAFTSYQGRDRYRKLFERAVLATFDDTEIHPERVGGHRVAAHFAIPVSFCLDDGCDEDFSGDSDLGSSLPTTAPGEPEPKGSVASLVTDVRGTSI